MLTFLSKDKSENRTADFEGLSRHHPFSFVFKAGSLEMGYRVLPFVSSVCEGVIWSESRPVDECPQTGEGQVGFYRSVLGGPGNV